MPKLVRLYIQSVAIGFALSVGFVVALVVMDVAGLQRLILGDMGWVAALMMIMFNGVVFSGVQFAIAIMRLAEDDDEGPRGGRMMPVLRPIPVRVEAQAKSGMARRRR